MKSFVKHFIIILFTFLIILWVQNEDDVKNNIQRKTIYEKYKIPVLSAAFVGLVINYFTTECSIQLIDIAEDFGFNNEISDCNMHENIEVPNKIHGSIKDLLNTNHMEVPNRVHGSIKDLLHSNNIEVPNRVHSSIKELLNLTNIEIPNRVHGSVKELLDPTNILKRNTIHPQVFLDQPDF